MARAHEILCPYCFKRWSTRVAAFRCTSRDAEHGDRVVTHTGRLGRAFAVKPGKPVRCDCGAPTRRVCPECHANLPQRFADAPSRSLALIGTKASGKSHFIAVVLHELEHRVGPRYRGSLTALDDATRDRIDRDLHPRLYEHGVVLDATRSARGAAATSEPLVTRLTVAGEASNLVFFDAAGEDLQSLEVLEREGRYVTQPDGLILLVDPLQIAAVRDELAGVVELPEATADVYTMLGRLGGMIREARGIAPGKPIDVPLAIAISKVDALAGLLPPNHPVFALPRHDGSFDRDVARDISEAMRAEVVGWVGERLDTHLREEFADYAFFGVSALGASPVDGRLQNGVAPLRVEDPVLWLLDEWGALPR